MQAMRLQRLPLHLQRVLPRLNRVLQQRRAVHRLWRVARTHRVATVERSSTGLNRLPTRNRVLIVLLHRLVHSFFRSTDRMWHRELSVQQHWHTDFDNDRSQDSNCCREVQYRVQHYLRRRPLHYRRLPHSFLLLLVLFPPRSLFDLRFR